jgi:hypothetical protein
MNFNWNQFTSTEWFAHVLGYTLSVRAATPEEQAQHSDVYWVSEIGWMQTNVDRIFYPAPTAEEIMELTERAFMNLLGHDALPVSAAFWSTLIEKKWGVSTNNFIPLSFPSLLDARWSEMFIPTVGRCFVAESKTQWLWVVSMINGHQQSGTCGTLHDAKRESVLAAMSMHVRSLVQNDYDTLQERLRGRH